MIICIIRNSLTGRYCTKIAQGDFSIQEYKKLIYFCSPPVISKLKDESHKQIKFQNFNLAMPETHCPRLPLIWVLYCPSCNFYPHLIVDLFGIALQSGTRLISYLLQHVDNE